MQPRLNRQVNVRFNTTVYTKLLTEAETQGISIAEVVRRIVEEYMRSESARQGYPVVEDAVRRVIEPHVEKLAGMIAHNGVAAGTAAWLAKALVNLLTEVDPDDAWDQAMARAKAGVRRSMKENTEVDQLDED